MKDLIPIAHLFNTLNLKEIGMLLRKLFKSLSVIVLLALCTTVFMFYGEKWRDQATAFIAGIYEWSEQGVTDKLPELRVGYIPIADAAQLYVAQDLDLFRKQGITVKPIAFAGGAKIIQALSAGELDVGFTGTVPLVQANSRGLQIRAITGGSVQSVKNPYQALVVPENSNITTPKQLSGTTIGVNVFKSIDHSFTLAWLEKNGVETKSIKFVEIPFPQMEAALSSGQIQASSMIEPFITLAKERHGVRVLNYYVVDVKPEFEMTTYVVTLDKVNEHHKEFKAFQLAIGEATILINSDKANLVNAIAKNTKLDEKTVSKMTIPSFGNKITVNNIEFVSNMLLKLGFIEKTPNLKELILDLN